MASSRANHSHGNHPPGYAPGNGSGGGLPPSPLVLGWGAWMDASDAAQVTLDGTEVVTVADKILAGATYDRLAAGQGPTQDPTTKIVSFNGTNQGLVCTNATILGWHANGTNNVISMMALAKYRSATAFGRLMGYGTTAFGGTFCGMSLQTTGASWQSQRRGSIVSGGTRDSNWHAFAQNNQAGASNITDSSSTLLAADHAASGTLLAVQAFTVGFRKNSGTINENWAALDILEHVILLGAATAPQIAGVRAYWAAKHGRTA